jgi:SAM-dependent methyltransferase
VLRHLPTVVPAEPGRPHLAGPDHPIRKVTHQIAFEPGAWTDERRSKVAALFDELAPDWHAIEVANRRDAVVDALDRGGPFPTGPCLELGSGIGAFTADVLGRFDTVIAADLSMEMLRRAPADAAPRVLADGSALPFPDGSIAAAVLVNMFLFPAEIDRVLAPDGVLVWVSSLGDTTPIHLSAESVEEALPGEWDGVAAEAGWGTWSVFRRGADRPD